jgi:hypothetical protein
MTIDLYSKGMLTIIAAAAVILVFQNLLRVEPRIQKVQICDLKNCADLDPIAPLSRGAQYWGLAVVPSH